MKTAIKPSKAAEMVHDGAVVHIGGFMAVGTPHRMIDALVARGVRGLTIVANDTALPGVGIGKLISAGVVSKAIVSHIGLNPETQKKMIAGEIDVELVPQGTLVERIRAAGFGLGGVLTATGLGTPVEEGKQIIDTGGKRYLLEVPIWADFALIAARQADYAGNLEYSLTAHNFNPIMAMAARTVIAEPTSIVPVGMIPPDAVKTPGVIVHHILERAQ
jgi:acetate CoA/acetoacetate CoA-transferase alpha subunit